MTRKLTNNEYAQPVVPVDGDGNIINGAVPANTVATGNVTALDVTASPHTTPTAGSFVPITLPSGAGTTALQITGTWAGQLEFEGSVDLVNYVSVQASNGTATVNAVASAGAMNSIFVLPGAGYRVIRVRASAWTSGTAVITFVASVGTSASIQTGALPAGTNAIGTVTTTPAAGATLTLHTSAARTADGTGTGVATNGAAHIVVLDITNKATDSNDTLDVYVDALIGTLWTNVIHFAQALGNGTDAERQVAVLCPSGGTAPVDCSADAAVNTVRGWGAGSQLRARWVIVDGGSDADQTFTFSVLAYAI